MLIPTVFNSTGIDLPGMWYLSVNIASTKQLGQKKKRKKKEVYEYGEGLE